MWKLSLAIAVVAEWIRDSGALEAVTCSCRSRSAHVPEINPELGLADLSLSTKLMARPLIGLSTNTKSTTRDKPRHELWDSDAYHIRIFQASIINFARLNQAFDLRNVEASK